MDLMLYLVLLCIFIILQRMFLFLGDKANRWRFQPTWETDRTEYFITQSLRQEDNKSRKADCRQCLCIFISPHPFHPQQHFHRRCYVELRAACSMPDCLNTTPTPESTAMSEQHNSAIKEKKRMDRECQTCVDYDQGKIYFRGLN